MDFVVEGGFTCHDVVAQQLLDLASRVPVTRERLTAEIGRVFEDVACREATPLLLAASHILGEYSTGADRLDCLIQPLVLGTEQRVQESVIQTAFRLSLWAGGLGELGDRLAIFEGSAYAEVQNFANLAKSLLPFLGESGQAMAQFRESLLGVQCDQFEPLEPPAEFGEPIELFAEPPHDCFDLSEVSAKSANEQQGREEERAVILQRKDTAGLPKATDTVGSDVTEAVREDEDRPPRQKTSARTGFKKTPAKRAHRSHHSHHRHRRVPDIPSCSDH
jgi:hypothetical protein